MKRKLAKVKHKVVVVLVNYNNCIDTRECLVSIKESKNIDPYVIIVDNKSENSNHLKVMQKEFEKTHIIFNEDNYGFGKANNIGIKWAKRNILFDYLMILNNDTLVGEKTISELVNSFCNDRLIGVTTGRIMFYANPELVWYGGGKIVYWLGGIRIRDFGRNSTARGANRSGFVSFASGCLMMFSKQCIEKIGGFDEDFFMYSEDLELSLRLIKQNFKIYYNSNAIIFHKVQGSFKNSIYKCAYNPRNPNATFLLRNMLKNQILAFSKHLTNRQMLIFKTMMRIKLIKIGFKFCLNGRKDILEVLHVVNRALSELKD